MRISTRRVFPGWWVALGFSVMVFLPTGVRFIAGPFMPLLGRLVDRVGVRPVIVGGALALGGSLVATATGTRLWHLHLWFGVLASLGIAARGHVVASAGIARWFTRRRATAASYPQPVAGGR